MVKNIAMTSMYYVSFMHDTSVTTRRVTNIIHNQHHKSHVYINSRIYTMFPQFVS